MDEILKLAFVFLALGMPVFGLIGIFRKYGIRQGSWCAGTIISAIALNEFKGAWDHQKYIANHAWTASTLQPIFNWMQSYIIAIIIVAVWYFVIFISNKFVS